MTAKIDVDGLLGAIADKIAERVNATADGPRWRTVIAEAARRGFPTTRAFRDWVREHGVTLRGTGKHQIVDVAEVDAAFERVPSTPQRDVPPVDDDDAILAASGLKIVRKGVR